MDCHALCASRSGTAWRMFLILGRYNGYDATLVTSSGAAKNSIDKTKNKWSGAACSLMCHATRACPSATRLCYYRRGSGRHRRQPNVEVRSGDILLVRTGHMSTYLVQKGNWNYFDLDTSPGVSVYTAPWLHAREIAAIGSDNYAVEVRPRSCRRSVAPSTSAPFPTWA